MKILWFTNTAGVGSEYLNPTGSLTAGSWLYATENALKEKIELHIAYYYLKYSPDFTYKNVNNYPICNKNYKLQMLKSLFFRKFTDQEDLQIYLSIIDRVKPDLIHIHGTENPFGCLISKVNIPVIVSIQGITTVISEKFNHGLEQKYLKSKSITFSNGLKGIIPIRSFKSSILYLQKMKKREISNLSATKHIIGRTEWDKRVTSVLAPRSIYFHCDEILRDEFYKDCWLPHSDNNVFIIHSTSADNALKGFETICATIIELVRSGMSNLEWRVAGICESDHIVSIAKRKFKSLYPKNNLVLLGSLNGNQLIAKLKEADLFVMASHIENSPNNLCEAMILGLPCIATFVGGTGTILKDGTDGILIQDNDPWAMAGAILELKSDPEKALELGTNARRTSLLRHNKENNVNHLLEIYSTLTRDSMKY